MTPRARPASRSFYVESLGCAKNQVDSEVMIAALERAGWLLCEAPEHAEVVIVNTCGFISPAKKESIETSLQLKTLYPDKKVLMVGCLTERYGAELAEGLPEIDGFLGNKDPTAIVELVQAAGAGAEARPRASPPEYPPAERTHLLSFPGSAYVKVAEGCGNRCTYCAIPLIRGDLASRPIPSLIEEVKGLLDRGARELILIAQDLGSFGLDRGAPELPLLLQGIAGLSGRFWVRLLYIHPDRFPRDILDIAASDSRFLPYFDLPFQHASPRILRAMGRRADPEANLALLSEIRSRLPHAAIRSTFLVGFPGESEADFQDLLDFQARARFQWLGAFAYSREEGTKASSMKSPVPAREAQRRLREVEDRQEPITNAGLDAHVGQTLEVLVEEKVQGEELSIGRAYLHAPEVDGLVVLRKSLDPGQWCRARVTRRNGVDLEAEPVP